MAVNEWLAQVYGTNGAGTEEDVEKTAQAMMLSKLAEAEGIDLSGLNEEQLQVLADQVVAQDGQVAEGAEADDAAGQEMVDPEMTEEDQEKVAQAKFAEADFLGRVMAHSFHQEMQKMAEEEGGPCEKCGKDPCECPAAKKQAPPPPTKEAQGPLTQAIYALGGHVDGEEGAGSAQQYVEKLAEARALEMLREAGFDV